MEPGPSIVNMAEAMLQEEYKSSHEKSGNNEGEETSKHWDTQSSNDLKRSGRSVVIQVPPKRRKVSIPFSPKEVVDALNRSMSMEERLDAIYKAVTAFDHDDQALHDAEIQAGADIALVKMLAFLEFKAGFRRPPLKANMEAITKEISLTCQALEMVYRASTESVGISFNRVGTDLLHIVVVLIDDEMKARMEVFAPTGSSNDNTGEDASKADVEGEESPNSRSVTPPPAGHAWSVGSWDRDLMLRKASKLLGHCARVGKATRDIAHFPGFLGSALNLINIRPYDAVPWEARLSCLWSIANLACNAENMMMMLCTPDLVTSLVNIGFRQAERSEPLERTMEVLRAQSIASRALSNLSFPPENKILMSENVGLVRALCQLAVQRRAPYSKSKTMQEILVQTRRHAVGALRNLAAAPRRSKIGLCEYNNGKILDVLTDVALNDTDQKTIDLSFAAVHNLAIHDTAEMMVERPALVLAMRNALLSEEPEEERGSPRGHASSTLLVLERSITPEMSTYPILRELLDSIQPSKTDSELDAYEPTNIGEVEDA